MKRPESTDVTPLPIHTPRVALRPVVPTDYALLREMELGERLMHLWRHGGAHPSPEQFAASLWNGVVAQFMVVSHRRGTPHEVIGTVSSYAANPRNRFVSMAAARFVDGPVRSARFIEACGLFVDYTFSTNDFRKIYMETPVSNAGVLASLLSSGLVQQEGYLREHIYMSGEYRDVMLLTLSREVWMRERDTFITLVFGNSLSEHSV